MIRETQAVVVVGAQIAGFPTLDREVKSSMFDDDTDTWALAMGDGDTVHSRVVIACDSPLVPWIPNLPGRNGFRGVAFHAATSDPHFDPSGKHIAVIGSDSTAGSFIEQLPASTASVTVFPHPPRRIVPTGRRSLRRKKLPHVVISPIDSLIASGIRTRDGDHHDADAIVYGTGFTVADRGKSLAGAGGLTIHHAWTDGMEPYLGVALQGFPNYFMIDRLELGTAMRYITKCLRLMRDHTRIEVRRSSQQVFNERVYLHRPHPHVVTSAFEISSGRQDDIYDGAARLTVAGTCRQLHARLTGHVDPIDGQYHWQGTLFGHISDELLKQARSVTLAVGERNASARITEQTPQGTYSIAGVGAPPFALRDIELATPQL